MRRILYGLAVLVVLTSQAVSAQSRCSDGTRHDDGAFENGYGSSSLFGANFVMRVDPPATPATLDAVCICWQRADTDSSVFFDITVWDSDGPGGSPGTLLGSVSLASATGVPQNVGGRFYRFSLEHLGIVVDRPVYIGPFWDTDADQGFFVCGDESPSTPKQPAYGQSGIFAGDTAPSSSFGRVGFFPGYRAMGIRAVFSDSSPPPPPPPPQNDPPPPYSQWSTSPGFGGFEAQVRVNGATQGSMEPMCIGETLCVSGALAGRPEVFIKVIGPRPNGFLWVQVSRFTPARVEVWVRQVSSGAVQYYDLAPVGPASDNVSGLQDREAFAP